MGERREHAVLQITVMCAGRPAPWQVQIRVRGDQGSLTLSSPQALAEHLRQRVERPVSTPGLR